MVIPEVSRDIIKAEQLCNGDAIPWGNAEQYALLVLEETKKRLEQTQQTAFVDRSLIDTIAYLEFLGKKVPKDLLEFPFLETYYKEVFFTPSWEEIYVTDAQRPQKFEELKGLEQVMLQVYGKYGFLCKKLSKVSIQSRIKQIESYNF